MTMKKFAILGAVLFVPATAFGGGYSNNPATAVPGAPTAYLGQVATRSFAPNTFDAIPQQIQTRTTHFARQNISSLQIMIPNWYAFNENGESNLGGTASVTASVEYPSGTFTRITFSGSNTGTVAGGSQLLSDSTVVSIPNGAAFFIRIWFSSSAGFVFSTNTNAAGWMTTDGLVTGTTTPDLTGGGSVTQATLYEFFPVAIVAQTTRPAVCLTGDSRVAGIQDTADSYGDLGEFARTAGPGLAYINLGSPGETAREAAISYTNRLAITAYCSHITTDYGGNDVINDGISVPTTITNLNTFIAKFAGKEVWAATFPPITTSTDGWATTTNQTTVAGNTNRVTFNTDIRTGGFLVGLRGYIDMAAAVESGLNSGLWAAPGYTPDGIHESLLAATKEQAVNIVPIAGMTR